MSAGLDEAPAEPVVEDDSPATELRRALETIAEDTDEKRKATAKEQAIHDGLVAGTEGLVAIEYGDDEVGRTLSKIGLGSPEWQALEAEVLANAVARRERDEAAAAKEGPADPNLVDGVALERSAWTLSSAEVEALASGSHMPRERHSFATWVELRRSWTGAA
jgi:hypothetical protein